MQNGGETMRPFQTIRYEAYHAQNKLQPCTCRRCRFAVRLGSEPAHFGVVKSRVKRLDFRREEALVDTAKMIHEHYDFVAQELQQPFMMLFTW